MPELPEVETTLRGISAYVEGAEISNVVVRNAALRWPVPKRALRQLIGQHIDSAQRRAKYILLHTASGIILLHLGMSGSLRVLPSGSAHGKHDHLDIELDGRHVLRLNDPRRFGCCLLATPPLEDHKLIKSLGPEPLGSQFHADYLFKQSRRRKVAVKNFIMDGKVVVGVGNIYASESLYLAGIRPTLSAGRISRARYGLLVEAIQSVLSDAIKAGGTTLNDFTQADGMPGYFSQQLRVYGRAGLPCLQCATPIKSTVIGQRNTFFCPACQTF